MLERSREQATATNERSVEAFDEIASGDGRRIISIMLMVVSQYAVGDSRDNVATMLTQQIASFYGYPKDSLEQLNP